MQVFLNIIMCQARQSTLGFKIDKTALGPPFVIQISRERMTYIVSIIMLKGVGDWFKLRCQEHILKEVKIWDGIWKISS